MIATLSAPPVAITLCAYLIQGIRYLSLLSLSLPHSLSLKHNTDTKKARIEFTHDADANIVIFSPNGMAIASGSDDGTSCLWDIRNTYQPTHTLVTQPATTPTYISAPQPSTPPTTSASGTTGPTSGLGLFNHRKLKVRACAFRPTAACFSARVKGQSCNGIPSPPKCILLSRLKGGARVHSPSPDGRFFVSGSWDNSVAFWPF